MSSPKRNEELSNTSPIFVTYDLQTDHFQEDIFSDLFSSNNMMIEEQTLGDVQNEFENTQSTLIPPVIPDEMNVPSPNCSLPVNEYEYEAFMAELCNENGILQPAAAGRNTFEGLLEDEPFPLDDISLDFFNEGGELSGAGDTESASVGAAASALVPDSVVYNASAGDAASANVGVDFPFAATLGYNASAGDSASENVGVDALLAATLGYNASPGDSASANAGIDSLFAATLGYNVSAGDSASTNVAVDSLFAATVGYNASAGDSASENVGVDALLAATLGYNARAGDSASVNVGVDALFAASVGYNARAGGIAFAGFNAGIDPSIVARANVRASTIVKPTIVVGSSFGNFMSPNTTGNQLTQLFQSRPSSNNFPLLPYGNGGGSSSSHQQFPSYLPYNMTGIGLQGMPPPATRMMSRYNNNSGRYQGKFWLPPPPLSDFPNFVHAWEGSLVGKIHTYRHFFSQARVVRKPISPITLTAEWWGRLDISLFVSIPAVKYTIKIYGGPVDYVFFHIIRSNNADLHDHLVTKNLCAKIRLPHQTVILSATESKYHFLGAIFPGNAVFVEPFNAMYN